MTTYASNREVIAYLARVAAFFTALVIAIETVVAYWPYALAVVALLVIARKVDPS